MIRVRRAGILGCTLALACGHAPAPRPFGAEARAHHYQDTSGLLVGSYGALVRQPLPAGVSAEARVVADYVRLDPDRGFDPTSPTADRRAPDAVTSASATAGQGEVATEWRTEGQLGVDVDRELGGVLATGGLTVRASREPDYQARAALVRAGVELNERNTAISVAAGYGEDRVLPVEVARGEEARWPAEHDRWTATLALVQLLSPTLVAGAGAAITRQAGTLASPYRRAVVRPNLLLPEALPDRRTRATGYLALSASLSPALALHLQPGAYADSWGVRALIPALTLAAQIADGFLLEVRYRLYVQTAASFYAATYDTAVPIMSGDLRLGPLRDHGVGLELRRAGALPVRAGYEVSVLDYRAVGARVVAHVFSLGLELGVVH